MRSLNVTGRCVQCLYRSTIQDYNQTDRFLKEEKVGGVEEAPTKIFPINDIYSFTNYHKLDLVNICQAY